MPVAKEKQDLTPVRPARERRISEVDQERIDSEICAYLFDLPPNVDKLRASAEQAVREARDLRMEARRTTTASQSAMARVVPKK